jgi:hypothetical protein
VWLSSRNIIDSSHCGDISSSLLLPSIIMTTHLRSSRDIVESQGEAIAWHLLEALNLPKDTPRIVFHEITKGAITRAITEPRIVDYNLVDAQQAPYRCFYRYGR